MQRKAHNVGAARGRASSKRCSWPTPEPSSPHGCAADGDDIQEHKISVAELPQAAAPSCKFLGAVVPRWVAVRQKILKLTLLFFQITGLSRTNPHTGAEVKSHTFKT